ncbi:unnamed protein product [Fructobacillus tropaeoli]|nr:unnamed protein product [Fructobacillus tropaeoli]
MEVWNIVTTLVTVAVVGLGGVEVGYYLAENEHKHSRRNKG